jgi:hypothetical protein
MIINEQGETMGRFIVKFFFYISKIIMKEKIKKRAPRDRRPFFKIVFRFIPEDGAGIK